MKCRVSVRAASVVLGLGLLTVVGPAAAPGQTKPAGALPPPIPAADKGALNAEPFRTSIRTSIAAAVSNIQSDKPDVRSAARDWLATNCSRAATPSPSYVDVYAAELGAAVLPILQDGKTVWPVRFNIAVAVGGVAETRPGTLTPAVVQLLKDKDSAVVYRGMQAARPLVLGLFTPTPRADTDKLIPAIVEAVKAQKESAAPAVGQKDASLSGLIATEAYNALVINPGAVQGMTVPQLQPLADPILDLLEFRTSEYAAGLPSEPGAEKDIFTLLQNLYRSGDVTVVQQHRIIQDLVNYCSAVGQRANLATQRETRPLSDSIRNAAQALNVLTGGGPGVTALGGMARTAPLTTITTNAALVYPTVSGKADFKYVQKPLDLTPMTPPPATPVAGPATPVGGTGGTGSPMGQ